VLGEVDIVAAEDTRRASNLLGHIGVRAPKLVSLFEGNEAARSAELASALQRGDSVAVISEAGSPSVSDPGERAVRAAIEIGARVEVIPGPVAAVTALVGSGLRSQPFAFYGFPPRQQGARRELFGSLRAAPTTLVFYEAPDRVGATLADLRDAFGAERRGALARELTKVHEEYVRGSLSELAERYADTAPRGECTIVVEGADEHVEEVDIEAAVRELLEQGLGPKDVAARLVVMTGKPKRQLYQLALSLARERDADG
jgi:16S rRNA (cytidine1402-2'-O)-methyltransferase